MHAAPPTSMAIGGICTKIEKGEDEHHHQGEGAEDRTNSLVMSNIERGEPKHRSLSSCLVVSNSEIVVEDHFQ